MMARMKPIVLIHGYSAESKDSRKASIQKIYGDLPQALRKAYGAANVVEIDLARYISLDDGISLDDISRAMHRELEARYPQLLQAGFHCLVHSTGALVVKNWLRQFSARPSPLQNLVHLAGANWGSGWAHIGKTQFAKWGRAIFGAGERGVRILHALELGSSWTIDLHLHFLKAANNLQSKYGVYEHVIVGTQADVAWYEAPVRYAKEDGSDGVVRAAASNLNFNYLRFRPTGDAKQMSWKQALAQAERHLERGRSRKQLYELARSSRPGARGRAVIPFAIPYRCAHSGEDMGVVTGKLPREQVMRLIDLGLRSTPANWKSRVASFEAETQQTYAAALAGQTPSWWKRWISEPRAQYDKHAQVVFRLRDQDGRPVEHFDIFFDSVTNRSDKSLPLRDLIEATHINGLTRNCTNFYLRTDAFGEDEQGREAWLDRVPAINSCHIDVSATEPGTQDVCYIPFRFEFSSQQLRQVLQPHRTTIIDIELWRVPSDNVYKMVTL